MKKRILHIIIVLAALFSVAVLFVTYGTVLPAAPFAPIQLNGPSSADSNEQFTVVVDSESRRALIMNSDGDLTGVVSCMTTDSPIDAITDACVSNGHIYLSGVRFAPDSDTIQYERVVVYDKGGNLQNIVYEIPEVNLVLPSISSLSDGPDGAIVTLTNNAKYASGAESSEQTDSVITFQPVNFFGAGEKYSVELPADAIHDSAFSVGEGYHYAVLNIRGVLDGDIFNNTPTMFSDHAFSAIDISGDGTLYACDDKAGSLCTITPGSYDIQTLVEGDGFQRVHENNGAISLVSTGSNKATICDKLGTIKSEFTEVKPSFGYSARMLLVWACGLYLLTLVLVLGISKVRRLIKEGKTEGVGPMLLAVAVMSAVAVAFGGLSFSSYQSSLAVRAQEINMCADYLTSCASDLSSPMEKASETSGIRGSREEMLDSGLNLIEATAPALLLVTSANQNGIGMYFSAYGKNDEGIFYLYDSAFEYVMGTSAPTTKNDNLKKAFESAYDLDKRDLYTGHTLRDTTQYRLVQIPTSDGKDVAGVIEIGSKMRSFESSITGNLAQRVLALLVIVLIVYLAYTELRACGRCLFTYRQHKKEKPTEAIAALTRPFTLAITMLTSIDSVMTVLIARDLLSKSGLDDSSALLALPAVMLGIGMILGQSLYAIAGPRVRLRRLMAGGAAAMLLCACATGLAVASEDFWLYCVAKLVMAIPFGMLYVLGYSLPRLARGDEMRKTAAGGVKRTDTSAAALGTVLGGYSAQILGNVWVYALVAIACLPVIIMALNLLPKDMRPLESLARPDARNGRIRHFAKSTSALALAFCIVLPATIATGYASFLFPLFSADLGLSKSDINNICVLGQLVVFVCIGRIEIIDERYGKWRTGVMAIALLGLVFLLFSFNTTLAWSTAVVALVGLLCKTSDSWKAMWIASAEEQGVPTGRAVSSLYATRSLTLIAQPFILGGLLNFANAAAVLIIGLFCAICALIFFLKTRNTALSQGVSHDEIGNAPSPSE